MLGPRKVPRKLLLKNAHLGNVTELVELKKTLS
jgi:hypothetical protein